MDKLTAAKTNILALQAGIQNFEDALVAFETSTGAIDFAPVIAAAGDVDSTIASVPVTTIVDAVTDVETVLARFTVTSACTGGSACAGVTAG
eukprot:COSAG04_NODE_10412_length_779_cov_0.947059_1_plen_91_part_10